MGDLGPAENNADVSYKYSQQVTQNHTLFFSQNLNIFYLNTTHKIAVLTCTALSNTPTFVEQIIYAHIYRPTHINILKPLCIHPTPVTWSIIFKNLEIRCEIDDERVLE